MDKKLILQAVVVGELETNCYILGNKKTKDAYIIDPGAEARKIKLAIEQAGVRINGVILTHGHFDHTGALEAFDAPVYIHRNDEIFLSDSEKNPSLISGRAKRFSAQLNFLEHENTIFLGELTINVIHTPGHTPGSICLKIDDILLSGDTLFCRGIGRTDLPGGSYRQIMESIKQRIMTLESNLQVFPGHGVSTTIGAEKEENSLLWS